MELNKLGYTNVDALDVTQRMLDEAKKKKVYTKFICTPLTEERTPGIETGEYNAIISSGVVSAAYGHVRPPALLEMIRVVSEGECAPALSLQHPLFRPFLTIVLSIAFLVEPTSATSSRKRFFFWFIFFSLEKNITLIDWSLVSRSNKREIIQLLKYVLLSVFVYLKVRI